MAPAEMTVPGSGQRRRSTALAALWQVRECAPQELRRPLARDLVSSLWDSAGADRSVRLQELARDAGLPV